jgi:hypothetical protein
LGKQQQPVIRGLVTIFGFVIPLVALLTPLPVIWREERLWNFSYYKE